MKTKFIIFTVVTTLSSCVNILSPTHDSSPVSGNSAVTALVVAARNAAATDKLDAAGASLERALRIESHNPALWHELAKLRLQQGEYQQVESLAAKSNGWTGNNKSLYAENWRLIGQARLKRGDYAGAQAAFDKAAEIK